MGEETAAKVVVIREYDPDRDRAQVEEVERRCEVGPSGTLSIFTDLLGDPVCRVRHSPAFLMLVAEMDGGDGEERQIVGLIRGCIKTVTCGKKLSRSGKTVNNASFDPPKPVPVYTKLAYILGLRVSPSRRRMGIASKLVESMEEWFRESGAEYAYMATETDNTASLKLFVGKCGYTRFRTPAILVNPVFAHRLSTDSRRVTLIKLSPRDAELLYRLRLSTTEFFPRDIDSVLNNKLNLGTFLAVPLGSYSAETWPGAVEFLANPPESWAVLSVWNSNDVFRFEVRGASTLRRFLCKTTRLLDRALPFLKIPSVPNFFRPFGVHFLYGLGGEGPRAAAMMRALCGHAHNLARAHGCGAVATEVAGADPLRAGIPHWRRFSCEEDLWCIKRLGEDYSDGAVGDWTKSPAGLSIFVDPREV
ncbi:probable N-acetyltransferase HLS1 [Punica granatum]|uniref:Uncharacterized protein n=2 Tax=Punica granatum TaxID=22663 RepID=A0A2I0ILL7_PUNGR|nr:probable N-acetyltransferase HLS1 [Punica granatum]PKI44905.1 hypothetical protein CRG98_034853 [Punica granatum]